MKQFITPEQLLMLNNAQKVNLLDMWLPQVNTLAMAGFAPMLLMMNMTILCL